MFGWKFIWGNFLFNMSIDDSLIATWFTLLNSSPTLSTFTKSQKIKKIRALFWISVIQNFCNFLDFWSYRGNEKRYLRSAGVKKTRFCKGFSDFQKQRNYLIIWFCNSVYFWISGHISGSRGPWASSHHYWITANWNGANKTEQQQTNSQAR